MTLLTIKIGGHMNTKIYLSFDLNNFYASVQSVTGGFRGGGIIDFGGTKKVRQKLIAYLTNSVDEQ